MPTSGRPEGVPRPQDAPRFALRLVSAVLLLGLLAATCGRPEETPGPGGSPTSERPPPAGTLRLGYPEEPSTLNPIEARAPAERDILRAVLPSFYAVTPELQYRPSLLADEPEVRTEDGRMTVRFRLRDDVVWSDGEPITVEDVAFTWRVMTDPDLPVAVRDGFEYLADVVADSPTEGVLVFSQPFAGWRDLFSAGRFVLPAHAAEQPADVAGWQRGAPLSGGPFRIAKWTRGRSVVLERNPGFFGPEPLVERVEVAFVPDPTTAVQLLEAGLLDAVAPMLGVSWERRLGRIQDVETSAALGADQVNLLMNAQTLPRGIRRRVADAIDRQRFVDVVVREGRVAQGILAPEQEGVVAAWAGYGTDPPEDVEIDRELTLAYTRTELLDLTARYVQAELERAGVDVELVGLDADVFQGEWLPERRFDLALWEARSGPGQWLSRWFASDGGEAVAGLEDDRMDILLAVADRSGETADRALRAAQRRLAHLAAVLPLYQPFISTGSRSGVSGIEVNPSVDGILWNAWEWSKAEDEAAEAA